MESRQILTLFSIEEGNYPIVERDGKDLQPWEPMHIIYVGDVREVVQQGGAKTGASSDPGDPGKPPGQEFV